ncbi:MAG: hypothetical protein JKX68_07550 [Flavobacteriales bacterium]|nr:hypothetical protein [Flavobacteriales bacterium]
MNNRFKIITTIFITILSFYSCSKDDLEDNLDCEDFGTLSYSSHILPIIQPSCNTTACHTTGFSAGDFTTHAGVLQKVNNGSMRKRVLDKSMPQSSKLSDNDIRKLICWIDAGALNN